MAERLLICKVKRTDQTRAELYAKGHKYPDLRLFDLADLAAVGIDGATLPIGEERPARFWAVYTLSGKVNQKGNAYKDILTLEPIGGPATVTSSAVSDPAILGELRAIRALLQAVLEAQGGTVPDLAPAESEPEPEEGNGNGQDQAGELDQAFPRFGDGGVVPDNAAEYYAAFLQAEGKAPASVDALRAWVLAQRKGNGKH